MKKIILKLFVLIVFVTTVAVCSPPLRIMSYNLLNYPGSDAATRDPYFRAVIQSVLPDILVCEEVQTQAGVDNFRNQVLNIYQPGLYSSVAFHDGPDTDNMLFYKSDKVTFISMNFISTALRDIAEYVVRPKWSNETLRIYALHLKANDTPDDAASRNAECTILRNYLNQLPTGTNFIIVGDFNIYRSTEACYQTLISSTTDNDGRVKDPLVMSGEWQDNTSYKIYHTQSPRRRSFGGGSTGGLDDRFDLMLPSYPLFDKNIIQTNTYKAYGNDGNHLNDSINKLPNTAVPDSVAHGLHYSSDHLPVMCDFNFPDTVAAITYMMSVHPGWNLISLPVTVYNSSKLVLFPSAKSNAYYFTNTGQYAYDVSLRDKVGYWLKFDSSETFSLYGKPRTSDSINVNTGWNLIGGTGIDVLTSNITTIPTGIIQSPFYGYDKKYLQMDTLKSSHSFFIRVNASGKIVLK